MRIEGQCINCENMAVEEILDETMVEYLSVCDDCFKEVVLNVVNSGEEYFFEWAEEMYGQEKALGLTKDLFGEESINRLGVDEDMKKAYKSGRMITMFTYGILKYPHNIKREGGINIVENSFVRGHKMHLYASSFPITRMTNDDTDFVYGTLFEVPEYQVLGSYDHTEGYNPKHHPSTNMYNRIEVEVVKPNGEIVIANMYYANQRQFAKHLNNNTLIPTGNFDDRKMAKSYGWKRRQ